MIQKKATLGLQMKVADVLAITRDIQMADQHNSLDNFLILDLQKRFFLRI